MSKPTIGRSVQSATVYSFAFAVQRAIGFVMLPIYTRALGPAEYGGLALLFSIAAVAALFFSVGLEIAIVRTYLQLADDPTARTRYVDSVWRFLVVYPITAAVVLSGLAWPVVSGGGVISGTDVLLALLGSAVLVAGSTLPLAILRATQSLRKFLLIVGTSTAITPALTALFVLGMDLGVRGFLIGVLIGNAAGFVVAVLVLPWHRGGAWDARSVRQAVRFSLPLLPHSLAHWVLNLADRSILAGIVSATALGIYSLAANISAPLLVLVMSLNQGFMPTYAKAGLREGYGEELRATVVFQVAAVTGLTLAGALLGGPVADLLAPADFDGASALVPWIVLGFGFLGMYYIPMNGATLGAGRSKNVWIATVAAAAINVGLLLFFVPTYGIKAAAVAAAIGYFALLVGTSIWAHLRPNPIRYDWPKIVWVVALGAGTYAASVVTSPAEPGAALAVHAGWLVVFVVLVLATGVAKGKLPRRGLGV